MTLTCSGAKGRRVWLRFNPEVVSATELVARITARHAVLDLYIENPPIEEIVARLYDKAKS